MSEKQPYQKPPELPSKERAKTWLDHLPDSVVKKFKLRERLLGESVVEKKTDSQENQFPSGPEYTLDQIWEITAGPEFDLAGVNSDYVGGANEKRPVDTKGYRIGDYLVSFAYVPHNPGRPIGNGGRYELILNNSKLSIVDGNTVVLGDVYVKPETRHQSREVATRLLETMRTTLKDILAKQSPEAPITQLELFHQLMTALKATRIEQFHVTTSGNPPAFT